jgi:hypothetical protein
VLAVWVDGAGTVALAVTVPSGETVGMRGRRPRPAPAPRSAFAGFRFPPEVIVIAVRWYLRYALSSRDVEELMVERGVQVDHVTIYRWVLRFTPLLTDAARPCRHAVGDRWQVDGHCCIERSPRPTASTSPLKTTDHRHGRVVRALLGGLP